MSHDEIDRFLAEVGPSEPPASLRRQALERADRAWAGATTPDRWRQLWESRPLRLAWATAVLALAVANVTVPPSGVPRPAAVATTSNESRSKELQDAVSLPRLRMEYVVFDVAGGPTLPPQGPRPATAAADKETQS
jgi:hypothetical protein